MAHGMTTRRRPALVPLYGTLFHFLAGAPESPYNQSSIGPGLRVAFNQEQT
jgi:hypothetical protein